MQDESNARQLLTARTPSSMSFFIGHILPSAYPQKIEVYMNTPSVTLSKEAEERLLFWLLPPESIHPVAVIAAVTEIAPNTLQNMRVSGEGPAFIKRGGRVYYRKDAVVTWLEMARSPTEKSSSRNTASVIAAA